jgi:DNA-binding CsgD family transcriptional regulator
MPDRTAILTEREKEVLRHVHALKTSTQIAHILEIAEVSVNKRIDSARRKLGGISRRQAALLLASEEGGYDNLIPAEIVLTGAVAEGSEDGRRSTAKVDDGASARSDVALGERRNVFDPWQRLGLIFLAMALLAALASIYIALLRS